MKVIVEADGGSRGNPGPAGYGAVVWSADHDRVLAESFAGIGVATNNVAEYRGLIAGLEAAADAGATEVLAQLDSKLVVEQMSGRWRVKHPDLIPLRERALDLAKAFDDIDYRWIPAPRMPMPTSWPTRRWTRRPAHPRHRNPLLRKQSHRRGGPAPAALRPASCCCAMGRPRCRSSGATPGKGIRR